jgi:arylsulfatase A-like enzyme
MPGKVAAGTTCDVPVNAPDLVATFCAMAGVRVPRRLDGRDIMPLLEKPDAAWPYPTIYQHSGHTYGREVSKVVSENPKEAIYEKVPWYTAVIQGHFKLVHYYNKKVGDELYDLEKDPEELKNAIGEEAMKGKVKELKKAMGQELKRIEAGFGV